MTHLKLVTYGWRDLYNIASYYLAIQPVVVGSLVDPCCSNFAVFAPLPLPVMGSRLGDVLVYFIKEHESFLFWPVDGVLVQGVAKFTIV